MSDARSPDALRARARRSHERIGGSLADAERCRLAIKHVDEVIVRIRNYGRRQLGYLPARHTDFIFSVLAEEEGFIGVVAVLGLYMFVLWRAFETAQMARDRVGAFLAAGIAAILSFQVIYNVAMVAGLVPVKGLPLPLMSYGGSSVLSSLVAVGLILNVRMRRFAN